MTNSTAFSVACGAIALLVLATALALLVAGAEPTGRHRAGSDVPPPRHRADRREPWSAPAPPRAPNVRAPHVLPICSAYRRPVPVHVLRRTIMPKVPLVRARAARVTVRYGPAPIATPRVVPLWTAFAEQALRAEHAERDRQEAAEAAGAAAVRAELPPRPGHSSGRPAGRADAA
ncbi:hypothetical protein [Kitasatospora sp. NPDC088134]|uniref:hypothetical protein n=1 Tax=Kitasatospora sp. NPDC088134 TaxID=3364071 RepID=UPI0037F8F5A6